MRARVIGVIDTGGHLNAGGLGLKLIRTDTGERYSAVTESDGSFQFVDVAPGSYQLNGDFPGFAPLREGPFPVLAGEAKDLGTLTPVWLASTPSEARVVGVVRVEDIEITDGGIIDAGNVTSAAQGATVHVLSEAAADQEIDAVTVDAAGGYSLRLPPGRYTLRVDHPLYVSGKREGVVLAEGARVDLTSEPLLLGINPSTLTGLVVFELDRSPDAGAGVGVTVTSDTGRSVTTDMAGAFSLPGLPAGARTLRFTRAGYHSTGDVQSQLGAAETRDVGTTRLLLDRGNLTGTVEMADGSQLQSVTVVVAGTTYVTNVVADEQVPSRGTFLIPDVPIGAYTVRATRANYVSAASPTATVTFNGVTDVGLLRLVRVQGDFLIDDGDATNTAGYTRTTAVTLRLSNVVNAAAYRVVEGDATALAAAAYQSYSSANIPFTLSAGDGEKRLLLQIKDSSNNESAPLSAAVVLDQTAPSQLSLSIASGAGFTNVGNPLPLTVSALDTGSGLVFMRVAGSGTLDGNGVLQVPRSAYVRDATYSRSGTMDGVENVFVQVTDNAGNESAVATSSIVIDTLAPSGTVTIDRGARATVDGYTNSVQALLTVTPGGLEPNGGYLRLKLANSLADLATATPQAVSGSLGWFLDPVGEGTKTVHYRFVDAAGNQSPAQQATILYDASSPTVSATLTSAAVTNSRTVGLQINATDTNPLSPTRGLTLSESALFSGATGTPFPSGGITTYGLSAGDGPRVVYVRVTDAAGNEGTSSVSLTLDETVPSGLAITLVGTLADGTTSTAISSLLGLQVSLSQVGATGVLLTESSLTSCPSTGYQTITGPNASFTLSSTGGATRTVRACFIDGAGNVGSVVSDTIDVDTSLPSGCAMTLAGRRADGSATALDKTALNGISWSLSSCTEVPVEIFLTESTTTCSASASFTWQAYDALATNTLTLSAIDGTKTVRGCVRDRARNISSFTADSIVLDTTPPSTVSVLIDSDAAYLNAATRIARGNQSQVSVAGTATGAAEWAIAESATPTVFTAFPGTSPANFVFSAGEGTRTISALFRDDVGNVATLVSDDIVVDTVAPTLTALTLSGDLADLTSSELVSSSTSGRASLVQSGATLVLFGDATLSACPTTGYSSYSGGTVPVTLSGAGTTRTVRACVSDAAGNVAGPVTDTIDVDATTPTGCQLVLSGRRADGTASVIAKTARDTIGVSTSGCTETPAEIALLEGASVTCSAANGLTWVALGSSNTVTLSVGDGAKNLIGCVRDRARNTGSLTGAAITLDTQAPTGVSISIEGGAAYFNAALSTSRGGLNTNVTGAATGASEWALAEGTTPTSFSTFSAATPKALTLSAGDGVKTVQALFRDDVGNVSTLSTDTIEVDTTLPTLTAMTLSGPLADGVSSDVVTTGTAVTATLTTTGSSLVSFSTTSITTCPTALASYSALTGATAPATLGATGATRSLWACVSDAAGNVAGPVTDGIDVDGTTPTGCQLTLAGRRTDGSAATPALNKTATRDVGITLGGCSEVPTEVALVESGSAPTCSATASLNWVAFSAGTTSLSLSSGDVTKTVVGCVRDRAHNTNSFVSDTIVLDTTAPTGATVSLKSGAAWFNLADYTAASNANAISVAGSASGATEWALAEGATPSTFTDLATTSPRTFTFTTGDGTKTVRALFRDDVGNTTTVEVQDSIDVDTAPPTLTSVLLTGTLADGFTSTTNTAITTVTASLGTTGSSGVYFSTSSITTCPSPSVSTYASLVGTSATATLSAGANPRTVWTCVSDAAGNTAGPSSDGIDLDSAAPASCTVTLTGYKADGITAAPAGQTATRDVVVTLTGCNETVTDIALSEAGSAPTCTGTVPWTTYVSGMRFTVSSGDTAKTVQACVRDATRNPAAATAGSVTLDSTAPTSGPSITINSGATYFNRADYVAAGSALVVSVSGSATGATEWALGETPTPSTFRPTSGVGNNPWAFTLSAGEGSRKLYAIFRDALGNATTSEISDTIIVDTVVPSTTSVSVAAQGPTANEYTNSAVVTVRITNPPSDAVSAQLAQAASTADCVDADMASALSQGLVGSYSFSLTPTEGLKRVCVRFIDAAGNPSVLTATPETYADTVTLDTTSPTTPTIVDRDQYVRLADGANFNVTIATASTDTNFTNYEKLGGATTGWQTVTPVGLVFPFTLVNDGSETGTRNALRLRARDAAGNTSGESVVFVTADTNAPNAPNLPDGGTQAGSWVLLDEWVDNTRNAATAYWNQSPSADIASYRVSYGSSSGLLNGTFATQGASPVFTPRPDQTYLTLSGLPNNTQTWFQVEPVDLAGNVGPASQVKSMQPGVVSPNAVATLGLTNNASVSSTVQVDRLATFGRWLYVVSHVGFCPSTVPSTCATQLQIVDLGPSESAIQRGTINPNPGVPVQSPTTLYWANDNAVSNNSVTATDMVVDGPLLFIASGKFVHILNLANPASPTTLVDLDLSAINANYRVHQVSLIGDKLVLAGRRADVTNVTLHAVVQLAKLYDNNSATRPTTADVAVVETSYSPGPMVVTRDRLVVGGSGGGAYEVMRLNDALDPEPASATAWTSADGTINVSGFVYLSARALASGNYLMGGGSISGFSVFDGSGLWSGSTVTPVAATAYEVPAQFDVIGSQAFLPDQDSDGLRVLELSDLTFIEQSGRHSIGLSPTAVTTWGHYGVITSMLANNVQVRVVELATPRALTERTTAVNAGFDLALRPGLALTGARKPFDLLNGPAPSQLGLSSTVQCTYRSAFVDDVEVGGRDGGLYIFDQDALVDRDVATSPTAVSPETYVANDFPLSTRISGLAQWGNYLVLAEVRNTGVTTTDGVWLDVLDVRSLRDRYGPTVLAGQANRVAEYRVVASPANQGSMMVDVTMNEGRAALSIDDAVNNSIGTNVYFVDLRPVFDDDASTVLSAASLQGSVSNLGRARRTVIQGTTAYIATAAKITAPTAPGLVIVSVGEVMDEVPSTTLPASPPRTSLLDGTPTGSVTVFGSAAYVAPSDSYASSGLYVVDVSQPMTPTIQNFYPMSLPNTYCDNQNFQYRSRVVVGGSRLYLTDGTLHVFDLE